MWRIFGPIIHCNCSFFQKDLAEFVVRYCSIEKLPWNFLLRFESSAWPMLFATMATLSVSIVSMRLGSFTYSTFGSHCGQSFKLFYKKKKAPPQARLPTSWNTKSVETRWVTRFYYAHHLKVASHQFRGKFTSIGKTSKAVYGSEQCM